MENRATSGYRRPRSRVELRPATGSDLNGPKDNLRVMSDTDFTMPATTNNGNGDVDILRMTAIGQMVIFEARHDFVAMDTIPIRVSFA